MRGTALRVIVGADVLPDPNSGAAGTVIETSKALTSLGHDIESFWSDSLRRRISHGNLHYLLELPREYRRELKRRLAGGGIDVVQLSQPYAYLAGKYVRSRHPETLMIWRSHGLEAKVDAALRAHVPEMGPAWKAPLRWLSELQRERIQGAAVRWCDGIVVPCSDDKDFLVTRFGARPDRVRVIWHGVPDDYIDAPVNDDGGRWQRMLHVSQMSANKGTQIMFEVVAAALERVPEATMTWVCPKSTHELILGRLSPALAGRVRLLDWVTRGELRNLYDTHGIFVFPTLAEGAAKAVMEAMSRGMCVVASDTSGPHDYIQHGINGYLAPVADASQTSHYAVLALQDAECATRMGESARHTALDFRWSRCAAELVDFYRDLRALRSR